MQLPRRQIIGGAVALGAATAHGQARSASPTLPIAPTWFGRLRGRTERNIHVFKGIRYGADTAPNRFQPPRPPQPWTGVRDAFDYGPACPQRSAKGAVSEDCLFLNIWTPALNDGGKRPVLVYLHGGAHASGDGSSPLYDGVNLATRGDVVVVTLNHRLNVFGYGYFARLGAAVGDDDFDYSGNVGHLDIIQALTWVRDNIAEFGGDPSNVTLFGQSGGGGKIVGLMAMRAADGLYRQCLTMSGQHVTASAPLNATRRAEAYLKTINLTPDQVSQLKTLPVDALVRALDTPDPIVARDKVLFAATLDFKTLYRHPFYPDAPEETAQVPLIIGNTLHETAAFMRDAMIANDTTWETLPARLAKEMLVDMSPEYIIAHYRQWYPNMTPTEVLRAAATAGRSWRPHIIQAEARGAKSTPTWMYQLDFGSPLHGGRLGAYHGYDIGLIFDNVHVPEANVGTTPEQIAAAQNVADILSTLLIQFARTGDPHTALIPEWPRYELAKRATLIVDQTPRIDNDPRAQERRLFATVPYTKPGT
ncbi:carboxylesterase family protein [Asticcacaulis sp. ZE23SCel15]|uniref:carboxylesterase/lipase family protein n=1 Tax=Asticcacaulis sp. ZE23SCel15 TaxID=3059027 RepID=UPI00265D73C9|nr:carboxylesterase family protein [Asticcacaulis sp. ZE23SCel15]WKL57325.1 carboxylesterase family protein [Asticcacaulis sp. ZE23SCel15]